MEVKPGYKQTEVGVIPEEWDVTSLAGLVDQRRRITYGIVVPGPATHNGIPMIRAQDYSKGWADLDSVYRVSVGIDLAYKRSKVTTGDVLLTIVGNGVGNLAKVPYSFDGSNISQQTARLSFDPQIADADFYLNVLKSKVGREAVSNYKKSGAQPSLNLSDVEKFMVPKPPLAEQLNIASALSDVDALVDGLTRLIAKKRDLKQAAMQQLLTGQTRLPSFTHEWEVVCLNEITKKTAGFWGVENHDARHEKPVQVIRAGDISPDGHLTTTAPRYFSDSEYVKAQCNLGDVVITGSGSVGKVWWCDGRSDIVASNFVRVLRPNRQRVNGRFLSESLRSEATQRLMVEHIATGVMANLGGSFFSKAWLNLPPLPEQTAIAEVLTEMDGELAGLEQRREKTRALKQAMMQELLTGRTRLV